MTQLTAQNHIAGIGEGVWTMDNVCRRTDVFLVELDDTYMLVDQREGVMHVLNHAGAAAWAQLEQSPGPQKFVRQLAELGLLVDRQDTPDVPECPEIQHSEGEVAAPAILRSNMMLQVAASRPMARGGWF